MTWASAPAHGWAARALRAAAALFFLLLPFSRFVPLAPSPDPLLLPIFVVPGIAWSDVAVGALLLAGGAFWLSRDPAAALRTGQPRVLLPLLGLALLAFALAPTAHAPELARYHAWRWLLAAALYVLLVQRALPRTWAIPLLLLSLALQVAVGVGQVLLQRPLGLPGELALPAAQSGAAIVEVGGTRWLRAYGMTFHPNVLGGFLVAGLLLAAPLLRLRVLRGLWLWLLLGLLLTLSRSAWLALALTAPPLLGWLAWRQPALRRPLAWTVGSALLLGALALLPLAAPLMARLQPASYTEARSLDERAALSQVALLVIGARPLTGVGAGNFPLVMWEQGYALLPQPVHNVPLLLMAELGVGGGLLWLWLWFAPLSTGVPDSPLRVAALAAWLALCLIALWDGYPWWLDAGRGLLAALLAWCAPAPPRVPA